MLRRIISRQGGLLCLALFMAAPLGSQPAGIIIDGFVDPGEGWVLLTRDCKDLNIFSTPETPMYVDIYTACDDRFAYFAWVSTPVEKPSFPGEPQIPQVQMGVDIRFTDQSVHTEVDPDCYPFPGSEPPPPPWGGQCSFALLNLNNSSLAR